MHPLLRNFLRINWPLFGLMVGLLAFGIYAIHSATWMRDQDFAKSQLTWILVCTPMFFLITLLDYRWVRFGAVPLYILGILGLMLTMFIGEKRYGARSWLDLGPMSFQPSQLAIIAGIMTLALFLSNTRAMPAIFRILCCAAIVGAPWVMILIQPDLGSCIVWIPVFLSMLFIGRIPKRWLILMLVVGLIFIPLVVHFGLKPYQYARITTFLNPEADPLGDGWNITQSLIAIGSGGVFGKGWMNGSQAQLEFLPEHSTDFIFAVVGEELGLWFTLGVVGVFAVMFVAGLVHLRRAPNLFHFLLVTGCLLLISLQAIINLGVVTGVFPTKGMSLPFISAGLSNLLLMGLLLGILLNTQRTWGRVAMPDGARSMREVLA